MIITLPTDILILILRHLSIPDLGALARTCHLTNALVTEFGWTGYLCSNPRPSFSLTRARTHWSPGAQVHYDYMSDRSWSSSEFVARPLSRPWSGKMQPILAISPSRLLVAAGHSISSYRFGDSVDGEAPAVIPEGVFSFPIYNERWSDITGITFVNDGGLDQTLCVGFQDGTLQSVFLNLPPHGDPPGASLTATYTTLPSLRDGDFIESLSSADNMLLSLSSGGSAVLTNLRAGDNSSETVALNTRSWTSHLCLDSSGPYAAFGTSSSNPLGIHSITNSELSQAPVATLHMGSETTPLRQISSAVYGISRAPFSSPWGASPQIIASGWFDGKLRCYDLRSSSRTTTAAESPESLRPVLTMFDPMQLEPIYSVSCGGGSSSYIAAGSARHSVVSFWDVRSPRAGWSVHAPGNDRSPVYSVILESSRLYGATQSRPFVYDFGPGVTLDTYPGLPLGRGIDGLRRRKGSNNIGYYVTTYPHTTRVSFANES